MTRHVRWPALLAVLGGALVIASLVRFASTFSTVLVPSRGGTYTEGMAGFPSALNPVLCQFNTVDRDLSALLFRGLTRVTFDQRVVSDLASKWEISADGLQYTFTLDPSARWQDGAPVTVEDVLYTIRVMQDSAFPGAPYLGQIWRAVEAQEVDSQTVAFRLQMPFAPFLDHTSIGLLPSHLLSGVKSADLAGHSFNTAPVGNGRFVLESLDADRAVLRYADQEGAKPYYDRLVVRFYSDSAAVLSALERGDVDGAGQVPLGDLPRALALDSVNLYSAPQPEMTWVILNLGDSVLSVQGVRRALELAIDRQRLIDTALMGQAIPVYGPILPESWAYSRTVERGRPDIAGARSALEAAGWKTNSDGTRSRDGAPLEITLTLPSDSTMQAVATELARQWADIGVRVQLDPVSLPVLAGQRLRPRTFQAVLYRWVDMAPDPDPYPFWHSSQLANDGQNYSQLAIRKVDELLEAARLTSDQAARRDMYAQFQQMFADQAPGIFLYRPVYTMAVSGRVKGVQIAPLANPANRFDSFRSWYVMERRVITADATTTQR